MTRAMALMLMAAVMAALALALAVDRWLLARTDLGMVLNWLLMWAVLLSALMVLSRWMMAVSQALLGWLDRASRRSAQAKAVARRARLAA